MKIVHAGFDGLDVAFRGVLPERELEKLHGAKLEAQKERRRTFITLGQGVEMHVEETGAKGGFAFRCDTGAEGETWFFKRSAKEDWNIRVSVKSATLAILGYEGVKSRLYDVLERLGAKICEVSIGRVDLAIDFLAPDFKLDPAHFVAHAKAGRSVYAQQEQQEDKQAGDWNIVWNGQRVLSVTVGKMPNRQVIVYDKSQEVKHRKKNYWWNIWGIEDKKSKVWRVEVRAGKKYLKERLGISTWQDLEQHMGDAFVDTLEKVRMRNPEIKTSNISRSGYHPMWRAALDRVQDRFADTLQGKPSVRVIKEERNKMACIFRDLLCGTVTS